MCGDLVTYGKILKMSKQMSQKHQDPLQKCAGLKKRTYMLKRSVTKILKTSKYIESHDCGKALNNKHNPNKQNFKYDTTVR